MAKIVVLGTLNADLYVEVHRLPKVQETLPAISGGEIRPGGKGANTAAAASLLGISTYILGQVGSDAASLMILNELSSRNVHLDYLIKLQNIPSGQAIIILQTGGENSIISIRGANQAWTTLPETMKQPILQANALMIQRGIPDTVNLEAASLAHSNGVLVVMDAGGKNGPISDELLSNIDILSPNSIEIEELTGIAGDIEAAALVLINRGIKHVVVKMSKEGSLYIGQHGRYKQDIFTVCDIPVVDTTGAGDCFTAALVARLVEIGNLEFDAFKEAMHFASVAAFLSVTKKGAMESMPTREQVNRYLGFKGP
ncbi:hypothetical protein SteCoe_2690 [Stentor coeruleus]|uniref:Ribokinase n=1 Tax=Stentor coeruleus TaxID=5963 RepID=A0A1R2CYY9_9CILI|nr:hypothetical protein SteCoe_2690 [Stentor coeruleus]